MCRTRTEPLSTVSYHQARTAVLYFQACSGPLYFTYKVGLLSSGLPVSALPIACLINIKSVNSELMTRKRLFEIQNSCR